MFIPFPATSPIMISRSFYGSPGSSSCLSLSFEISYLKATLDYLSLPKHNALDHAPRPFQSLFPLCGNAFFMLWLQRNSRSSFKAHLRSPLLFISFLEMSASCLWAKNIRIAASYLKKKLKVLLSFLSSSFTCVSTPFYMEYHFEYKLHCT